MASKALIVRPVVIPGQQRIFETNFPLVLQNEAGAADLESVKHWAQCNRRDILAQSTEYGAILFRGFDLKSAQDFDAFVRSFRLPNFPYKRSLSNAVRTNVTERVFTANEAPSRVVIPLHHEMAQTPYYPDKLFFFCEVPPGQGGATPLCRSDALFEQLRRQLPEFVTAIQDKGLRYTHTMPAQDDAASGLGRSWANTLGVDKAQDAQRRLGELNYTWKWLADGSLRVTTPVLPGTRNVGAGRISFFNQLIAAFFGWKDARNDAANSVTLGDGTPLDPDVIHEVSTLADALCFDLHWQAGDVVLVDNHVTMHARRPFEGMRRVLASLVLNG